VNNFQTIRQGLLSEEAEIQQSRKLVKELKIFAEEDDR